MPGVRMSVQVTGAEEVELRFRGLKTELAAARKRVMLRAVIMLRRQVQSTIYSPEGKARRGIRGDVVGAGDTLAGLVRSRSRAAVFAQRGRPPGKMPPMRIIQRLLRRRGQERSRSSAFLVARAIARRGVKAHPVMDAALEAKRSVVIAMFREVVEHVLRGR